MTDLIPQPGRPGGEFLFYQTDDGRIRLQVRVQQETVWLTQAQMAELFQTTIPNVSMHIRNIFAEKELQAAATVKDFLTVRQEGSRQVSRAVEHYNLDVIISVGYRVKSQRGTQFRIWATQRLREYIVKGFAMDDDRLKQRGGGNYFEAAMYNIATARTDERADLFRQASSALACVVRDFLRYQLTTYPFADQRLYPRGRLTIQGGKSIIVSEKEIVISDNIGQ